MAAAAFVLAGCERDGTSTSGKGGGSGDSSGGASAEPSTLTVTQDQRREAGRVYFTDTANDGSIHCPVSQDCPGDQAKARSAAADQAVEVEALGRPWFGVLIPAKARDENNIVCVDGYTANPAACPPGWNGRLWRTHRKDQGLEPFERPRQAVCLPGEKRDICADNPGDTDQDFGFFCRRTDKLCRGIDGKDPYRDPVKPDD